MRVVAAVWFRGGRLFAAQRGPGRAEAGRWELPGGKVEDGEEERDALRRELLEELGVLVSVGERIGPTSRLGIVELVAYEVASPDEPVAVEHAALRWLGLDELWSVDWAEADLLLVAAAEARLRG